MADEKNTPEGSSPVDRAIGSTGLRPPIMCCSSVARGFGTPRVAWMCRPVWGLARGCWRWRGAPVSEARLNMKPFVRRSRGPTGGSMGCRVPVPVDAEGR